MVDQAGDVLAGALPCPQAHVEGVERQIGAQRRGRLLADDYPAEDVQDERDIGPPRARSDIRQFVTEDRTASRTTSVDRGLTKQRRRVQRRCRNKIPSVLHHRTAALAGACCREELSWLFTPSPGHPMR